MSLKERELEDISTLSDNNDNNVYLYCISSFNTKINNIFNLIAKNNEVLSIKALFKTNLKFNNDL